MRQRTINLFLISAITVFFVSCSSKSDIPVPEDAAFVLHIDGASLSSKLPWDEVKQSDLFKMAMEEGKDKDSLAMKILNDPKESGVNINSDAYMFMKNRGRGGYAAFVCNLSDAAKFESFLKQTLSDKKIETKDDLSFITNDDNVITWKKDRLILISSTPGLSPTMGNTEMKDSDESFSTDSLVFFAKEIYDLKKNKSLGNDSKFSSLLKEKGDMHIWVNAGSIYNGTISSILAITKAGLLFKGNISTGTINFDDGKITYKGKNYFNKELADLYKKHNLKAFDESVLQNIPAGNVDAMLAFNYPPEGLKEFLSLLGVDGLLNVFLSEANISIDDFVKANKGEILFSVSDFTIEKKDTKVPYGNGEEYSYQSELPTAKILFATSINQKASFDKLITVLTETLKKEGAEASEMLNKIPYVVTDKWFVAGNDSSSVHSFGTTKTNHDFISKIKGHPMAGYMNIQNFIKGAKSSLAKDSIATLIADKSIQTWNDIIFYGGEFKNGGLETYAEINMVDAKTNSLKQLTSYFGFLAKLIKEQENVRKEEYKKWDDMTPIVPPTEK